MADERISISNNEIAFDHIINKLSKKLVVPSTGVYNGIKKFEKINMKKVSVIPYTYDFTKYDTPDEQKIIDIRNKFQCSLLLIMVSRLIKLKRHHVVFPVIKELAEEGYDIKMLVLDEGSEKENLREYIKKNNLHNHIFLLGYKTDFINYMAASDMLIQPSLTDASNSVAKEMGLLGKAIAVSKGVGDYDDYVIEHVNGYLISTEQTRKHLKEIIIDAYNNPGKLHEMGLNLKHEIWRRFNNSPEIISMYETLL